MFDEGVTKVIDVSACKQHLGKLPVVVQRVLVNRDPKHPVIIFENSKLFEFILTVRSVQVKTVKYILVKRQFKSRLYKCSSLVIIVTDIVTVQI